MSDRQYNIDSIILRKPEEKDINALYAYKNDENMMELLGGYSSGYSRIDLLEWIEVHRKNKAEVLWIIANKKNDYCLGHVGFYKIDHRVRSAEFALLIGEKTVWNLGIGKKISRMTIKYGFCMLNLNRIYLNVLKNNERAMKLYQSLGFNEEGIKRQAQYKNGMYLDIILMSLLREEFDAECS